MPARILLMLALVAAATTQAKTSECQARCEDIFKACVSAGRMTQNQCRIELETCRKACLKKEKKEGAPG